MEFTAEQAKAIDISRLGEDACIVAGPGSGKTTVLVERYRQLLANGVSPSEILAITFTEKAAANMRDKLATAFAGQHEVLRKLERAHVSTIHGFCSRMLKENAAAAGVDPEFVVLDEQSAVLEQARALRETLDNLFFEQKPVMQRLLEAVGGADLEKLIPPVYDAMRAAGVRPAELRLLPRPAAPHLEEVLRVARIYVEGVPSFPNAPQKNARDRAIEWLVGVRGASSPRELSEALRLDGAFNTQVKNNAPKETVKAMKEDVEKLRGALLDDLFFPEFSLLIDIFEGFDAVYRARKDALGALDFNDLEFFAVRLLEENPDARWQIAEQFRQVMIDEFQDTSKLQARLVDLVRAPGRFYAVGDLNQSIYSFRHASPAVFHAYRASVEEHGAHLRELVENWRSREPILLTTQFLLNGSDGIAPRDLVPARKLPAREGPAIEVIAAAGEDEDAARELEAQWIANRVVELLRTLRLGAESKPARPGDFAILMRNTREMDPYLDALNGAGLDYNLNRRSGFLETREARDLLHLLRMIHNPRDEASTLAVLRSDFAGISDEALLRLRLQRRHLGEALADPDLSTLDAEDRRRLELFLPAFARCRAAAAHLPADRLILQALDEMGVVWDVRTSQRLNIEKFLNIARSNSASTLGELVTRLNAMREADPREQDSPIDETRDAVQIMSAHAAKGLEFPVVILAGLDKGVDSSSPVINFTPEYGLGVRWSPGDFVAVAGMAHRENEEKIERTEDDEANRLLYVALTRAEERLILTWAQRPEKQPSYWAKKISAAFDLNAMEWSEEAQVRAYAAPNGKEFEVQVLRSAVVPPPVRWNAAAATYRDVEILEPPLARQIETTVTATALSLFASCPRKYYLAGFLGWDGDLIRPRSIENAPAGSHGAAAIGTEVHKLLAGVEVVAPDWESVRLAQVFERSPLNQRARRAARREHEWGFAFAAGELIVRGAIDLWFEDAQGLTLVDYKTNQVPQEKVAGRARDYTLQLEIYALALERALGKRPKQAWLYFLRPDLALPVDLDRAAENVERTLAEFMAGQEELEFPLNVGAHCRQCEFFRTICPAKLP